MDVAAVWTRFTREERGTLEPLHHAPFRRAFTAQNSHKPLGQDARAGA